MPDWHAIQANAGAAKRFELRDGVKVLMTVTTSRAITLDAMKDQFVASIGATATITWPYESAD